MFKKLLLIFIVILIIFVGLIGCTEKSINNNKKQFIGEWFGTFYDSNNNITFEIKYIFYENDTTANIYYFYNEIGEREYLHTLWRYYTIENSQLCLTYLTNISFTKCYKYSFYNNYSNLKISNLDGSEEVEFIRTSDE